MIIKITSTAGRTMVWTEVMRRVNADMAGGVRPGQAFWATQVKPTLIAVDGTMERVRLFEGDTLVAECTMDQLRAVGLLGGAVWTAGSSFYVHCLPILDSWLAAPETLRAPTAGKYRTPMAQRTEICPCGGHHTVCGYHDDWLTCP
jgi:hypothetical protein